MDKSLFTWLLRCPPLLAVLAAWLVFAPAARAQPAPADAFVMNAATAEQLRAFLQASGAADGHRLVVELGHLDPRLRLAACAQLQPYLPFGSKPWGKTRVGLRCTEGAKRWNVSLPATVRVFGPAWVTRGALPAGHVIAQDDLRRAEIDLSAEPSTALAVDDEPPVGRTLARPVLAGEGLREMHLKVRQWFAAGEVVRIRAVGAGFAIASGGEAITSGVEGQQARVRLENGRVVIGRPVGERLVEIAL